MIGRGRLTESPMSRNTPPPVAAVATPGGSDTSTRGFLVTVRCTTPNAGGSTYVLDNMVKKLKEVTAANAYKDKKPYYIAKAAVIAETQIQKDPNRAASPGGVQAGAGVPAREVVRGAPAPGDPVAAAPEAPPVPFPDPVFPKEDMGEDWALTVLIAVVLDPPPPKADAAKPAPTERAAGR
jgi:hypothetical protein